MLSIRDLHVAIDNTEILHGVDLDIPAGEVHAIMGLNGSGKSTLTKAILGHEGYDITRGSIHFEGEDLAELDVEERARRGIFVGFQYPVEVPGVNNAAFMRLALNAQRRHAGERELSQEAFDERLHQAMQELDMDALFRERELNSGFSGGQKKRNELLQLYLLQPRLALMDETDSGLDIDALRSVADGINRYRRADRSIVLITHYQRLLDLVTPDVVHVMVGGRIVDSGGPDLAHKLEAEGYESYTGKGGA